MAVIVCVNISASAVLKRVIDPPGISTLLKSQAVGLPEIKNKQGRIFDEIYCVHVCICKYNNKIGKRSDSKAKTWV